MICQFMQFLAITYFSSKSICLSSVLLIENLDEGTKCLKDFLEKLSFGMYYDETFMVISKHCESSQPDNAKGVNEYKWPPPL